MSDEHGSGYPGGDPFIDPNDHDAVEREQRRREREAKRAGKAAKRKGKEAPAPPPKAPPAPPTKPRTPEQEFWDEPAEPATPPPLPSPEPGTEPPSAERAERGRKRLLGRRKAKRGAAVAGGATAASAAAASSPSGAAAAGPGAAPAGPPTGEQHVTEPSGPPTGEEPIAPAGPPTAEQPLPSVGPPTAEEPLPPVAPPTAEQSHPEAIPTESEAAHAQAAEAPQADPGPGTAETPRLDPNQPRREQAPPPRPVDETGAGDWEPPPPRDDWGFDEDFDDEGDPNMAGAARTGRRHGEGGNRRGGIRGALLRHPFRILAAVIVILILVFLNALFQPFHGDGHGKVVVDIPKGSSVGEVGNLLEKEGVISGGFVVSGSTLFQARVTIAGKRSDLFAGKFTMREGMSYGDAIDELTEEPKTTTKPGIVTVTIPEGYTRSQISRLAKEDGLRGNYMKATVKSKYLKPAKYGGKKAKNLEGFLFPDTWELKRHQPVANLVQLQLQDFRKKIKGVDMKYANSKNLTIYDVLTIASIIEHESGVAGQRKDVASVIYNRLHAGMTLGSDATVRFAVHNFTKPLTQSQLESKSPYNTRIHPGLPPGPISNPGIAAINAAAHPAKTNYLFFVTSPNCKTLNFAPTEAKFERDVKKYEASKCTE